MRSARPHLGLNAVEASEPEDLSSPQLPLGMVDLLVLLVDVLLWQLVLLGELARPAQEAQPAVGYAGDHLEGGEAGEDDKVGKAGIDGSEYCCETLMYKEHKKKGRKQHVTCPHTSSPSPRKTHHIHFSKSRG